MHRLWCCWRLIILEGALFELELKFSFLVTAVAIIVYSVFPSHVSRTSSNHFDFGPIGISLTRALSTWLAIMPLCNFHGSLITYCHIEIFSLQSWMLNDPLLLVCEHYPCVHLIKVFLDSAQGGCIPLLHDECLPAYIGVPFPASVI